MFASIPAYWSKMEPMMLGLKRGGLMNQCLEEDDTYRQGRHHVMAAINQILEWTIALEQVTACFESANLAYSLAPLHVAKFVVPLGTAYLASSQIKTFHISKIANFVQEQLGKISLLVTVIATAVLFRLGQQLLAGVTLAYLAVGLLDRFNLFSETTQSRLRQTNFLIANIAGLYFGGNFIRVMCVVNLVIAAVQRYFKYRREIEQEEEEQLKLDVSMADDEILNDDDLNVESNDQPSVKISLGELEKLRNDSACPVIRSHVHLKNLPSVREDVQIDEILDLCDQIDWTKHLHVLEPHLKIDKRWGEVGQDDSTLKGLPDPRPIAYFKRNLRSLVESIRDRKILQGKPQNYEMLDYYCRYIAQELKGLDEMSQADYLIQLGIDGGEYCGTGKFGIVEQVFESMLSLAEGLPLDMRILACLRQERVQVWQNIYQMTWLTNPFWQIQGYFTEINAVHNANLFINLIQAGDKFGIPHQAAQNDQTAVINPSTHYLAFSIVHWVEKSFWNGKEIPQCYFTVENPQGMDRLKPWKWAKLKIDSVSPSPYNQEAILRRLRETIGSPQISKYDIYIWWNGWIERQTDLSEDVRSQLTDEFLMTASINGEPLEIGGKIQDKFLIAILIEMGVLEKPANLPLEDDQE